MYYILLIIGFILLIKGADYFVTGSSNLAKTLKISSLIIGLTIVSLGTSAPETVVSTISSLKGANDISISNVIGSNIFNILVVLGITSIIKPINKNKENIIKDYTVMILSSIILLVFMCDRIINYDSINSISRSESLLLITMFIFYLYTLFNRNKNNVTQYKYHKFNIVDVLMLLSGLVSIILGGDLVVRSAKVISISWGISETLVGLTIVSIGTSLPELVTSIVAAYKKETNIAIGNVIGSNIYNSLLVLGIAGTTSKIIVNNYAIIDMIILIIVYIILYIITLKQRTLSRKTGILLLILYILFFIYIVNR